MSPFSEQYACLRCGNHEYEVGELRAAGGPGEATTSAGYSGTPLVRKLGLEPGMACAVANPPNAYWDLL